MFATRWILIVLATVFARAHARTWPTDKRTPCDIMVDVVNDLGLNLLKIHNINNENNIALSPYGVASILTALLEGVQGRAALEIQKCGGFPENRDVVRVGLRDIHRLLRSYFIPQEGFLSGLSLSTEKVILKPEYQSILRFYGFDMTSFNTPIYPNVETTTPMSNLTTTSATESSVTTTELPETTKPTEQTTVTNPTTLKPQEDETTLPTTITTMESTTSRTTITTVVDTTMPPETTTQGTTVVQTTLPPSTLPPTTVPPTTLPPETTVVTSPVTTTMTTQVTTNPPTTTTETITTTLKMDETTILPTTEAPTTILTTTEAAGTTIPPTRSRRALVDYFIAKFYDGHPSSEDFSYEQPIPPTEKKPSFLVSGKLQEPHVHFMTYEAVLPFFYIHTLNALALKFPLDSPKYYLLLVLPVDDEGIDRLICDIGNSITLKQIVSHLRPTYVRAVIPSFMLRGFVILTSSLQKIGIRQIFEPHQSDFSTMTDDKDIYVTNIEQAITVMIKNYMEPHMYTKNSKRDLYQYGPVEFKATHPFLYFVMDSEIDVTLVAGKILNPINSRIQ